MLIWQSWLFVNFWVISPPIILADELVFASYHIFSDAPGHSNSLFEALYKLPALLSRDLVLWGKVINFVLYIMLFGLVGYLVAKLQRFEVATLYFALAFSILATSVAMYLPELLYQTLVTASLVFFVLGAGTRSRYSMWMTLAAASISIALAALSKPHALFVLLFMAIAFVPTYSAKFPKLRTRLGLATAGVGIVILIRSALDFFLGSAAPLSLFGAYLDAQLAPSGQEVTWQLLPDLDTSPLEINLYQALATTFWNYFAVALLFTMPSLIIGSIELYRNRANARLSSIMSFALGLVSTGMLAVAWIFGAYITSKGDDHTDRILLRYAEFLIPLAVLALVYSFSDQDGRLSRRAYLWTATLPAIGFGYIIFGGFDGLTFQISDSLWVFSLSGYWIFTYALAIGLILITAYSGGHSITVRTAAVGLLSIGIVITSVNKTLDIAEFYKAETSINQGALEAIQKLPDSAEVLFVGFRRADITSILMQSGRLDQHYALENGYSTLPLERVENYDYIVAQEQIYPPTSSEVLFYDGKLGIYKLSEGKNLARSITSKMEGVSKITGYGSVAPWGFWASGDRLDLEFKEELAAGTKLNLSVLRHEGTSETKLTILLGSEVIPVDLPQAGQVYDLTLTLANSATSVAIEYADSFDVKYSEGQKIFTFGITQNTGVLGD